MEPTARSAALVGSEDSTRHPARLIALHHGTDSRSWAMIGTRSGS